MKRNHLDFLKLIVTLIAISLFNNLIFSITVEDIIIKSRIDPEFAWDMYLSYISNQETSNNENIDKLGRFLYAKRKLKDFEFAIKEDVEGLINFLKVNHPDSKTKYYLLSIFSEESLFEFVRERLKINPNVLYLFKLIGNYDQEEISKELLDILSKNKTASTYIQILLKVQGSETLIKSLIDLLQKQFSNVGSTEKKKKQLEIYKQITVYYPQYKIPEFERFDRRLSSKTFSFTEFLSNFEKLLRKVLGTLISSKQNFVILILILSSLTLILLLLIPSIRYHIYSLIGSWKMAALAYRKIVEKDPLNEEKRLKLAQLYEKAGMYEEAMNEYNFLKRMKFE